VLQEQRAFGVLITPVGARSKEIEALRRRGTAVVLVDRGSGRQQCSVSVNDSVGGELATAHLLTIGHRRLAFVGGPTSLRQVGERLAGMRQAVQNAGRDPESVRLIETSEMTVAAGREAAGEIVQLPARSRPTAVFCANDLLALGVLQQMTRSRIRVPEDVAIVGYDDIDFAAAAAVPVTSVRQPRQQLGRTAAELLIDEVDNAAQHQHRQVVFEPELVVRESTIGHGN
jgi:LacI family transcriptional regulator